MQGPCFLHTYSLGIWSLVFYLHGKGLFHVGNYVSEGPGRKCEEKIITEPKRTLHVFWASGSKKGCYAVLSCLGGVGEGKRVWEVPADTQSYIVPTQETELISMVPQHYESIFFNKLVMNFNVQNLVTSHVALSLKKLDCNNLRNSRFK